MRLTCGRRLVVSRASTLSIGLPTHGSIFSTPHNLPALAHSFAARRSYATSNLMGEDIFTKAYEQVKKKEEEAGERPRITEVKATSTNLPASLKRIDHLLRQIRRLSYREAMIQLKFCQKRIGPRVIETIEKARHKAELKYGLDPERLVLDEIYATKGQYGQPQIDYKAKARIGIMRRKRVHLTVKLKEVPHQEGEKQLGKFARGVNRESRKAWEEKRDRVAKEMGVPPLVVTTKQVELWDRYKEKVLNKDKATSPPADSTQPSAVEAST
jgi:large subunit ribosomal protein L22